MSWIGNVGGRLYRGEVSIDFVGRRRLWYTISGLILVISLAALFGRGLNESVDFKGGSVFEFKAPHATQQQVNATVEKAGGGADAIIQTPSSRSPSRAGFRTRSVSACTRWAGFRGSARPSSGQAGGLRSRRRPWKR
jgi:preprotein translocase subunit SecF